MGVAAGMVVGVPISNVLAATFDFSAAMAFFAGVTGLMFLLTMAFVPDLPVAQPMQYGAQLSVLKRPPVWLAIVAVICLNGSIFGVYNYLADYLQQIAALPGQFIAALLLVYGLLNIYGSYLGGNLLAKRPRVTVRLFPLCTIVLYCLLFVSGGQLLLLLAALIVVWGILGGINANINQYLLACVASDAPDFSNGLFLTAANLGCMAGTMISGFFIRSLGLPFVVCGGLLLAAAALLLTKFVHCRADEQQATDCLIGS